MIQKITAAAVKKVAQLGRLGLTAAEISRATQQLSSVLEHFSQIQKISTIGVPTADDVTGLKNITRADVAQPEQLCTTSTLINIAPATKDRQIQVKAVFE